MTTRYADLVMETAARLAEANTPRETWEAAVSIGNKIGARAMTCGAVMRDSRGVAWVRTSMEQRFLEPFTAERLYEVDPIQSAAIAGRVPRYMNLAERLPLQTDPRARDLHELALAHGYCHYVNHTWVEGAAEHTFALACDRHPSELFGSGTEKAFRAVSAMLSAAMRTPGLNDLGDRAFGAPWSRLSSAERDVLSYLGQGLHPEQIADHLARPVSQVQRLLERACRRLGTPSPEQAMSLMLVRGGLVL
ncbi:hypothetical protein [Salipiger sp. PrR002]|uniref:helix-turn-helix transcriptional regulator n=1 Tax=Salipiger sp. PrR002 TaxID=2706489 RepID=UPI0013B73A19|nr:hypothetical protein [Salipiger sp. PrR002]NDV98803.1 hypothetical protein [Salipiger sp. PrR002]NDW55540.1 hypothetical protein [Salipiger sp. PrR004]